MDEDLQIAAGLGAWFSRQRTQRSSQGQMSIPNPEHCPTGQVAYYIAWYDGVPRVYPPSQQGTIIIVPDRSEWICCPIGQALMLVARIGTKWNYGEWDVSNGIDQDFFNYLRNDPTLRSAHLLFRCRPRSVTEMTSTYGGPTAMPPPVSSAPVNLPFQLPACPPGHELWARVYLQFGQLPMVWVGPIEPKQLRPIDEWKKIEQAINQGRYECRAISPSTFAPQQQASTFMALRGLPGENMSTDLQVAAGLGAWLDSVHEGLGILGDPNLREKVPAGTYEVTGTQVALRQTPNGTEIGRLNNKYGRNNDLVVEPIDLIETNAQVAYNVGGHNWAEGTIKNGELAGQKGFVATDFLGPVGYTKSHNGTGPIAGGGGGGGITPVSDRTETITEKDYTPYILGGAAVLGLGIIGWAVLAKPKKGAAVRRMGRRRTGARRHRR